MATIFIPCINKGVRCTRDGCGRFRSHSWVYGNGYRRCSLCGLDQSEYTDSMFRKTFRDAIGYEFIDVLSEKNDIVEDAVWVSV